MTPSPSRRHGLFVLTAGVALALLGLAPRPAHALQLLDEPLALERGLRPAPLLAAALPATRGPLDFDLLGKPPKVRQQDDGRMKLRRTMLSWHQGIGLGLVALQLASTVTGQLNYSDKFGSDPAATRRWELTHSALAYGTLGVFAANGTLALLAPRAKGPRSRRFDRVMVHRLGMLAATVGMLSQGALGVYTDQREGRLDQAKYARTHLAIGYGTLAAVGIAVGALVF